MAIGSCPYGGAVFGGGEGGGAKAKSANTKSKGEQVTHREDVLVMMCRGKDGWGGGGLHDVASSSMNIRENSAKGAICTAPYPTNFRTSGLAK